MPQGASLSINLSIKSALNYAEGETKGKQPSWRNRAWRMPSPCSGTLTASAR